MQNNEIKNVPDLWKNSAYVPTSNETAFQGGALSNLLQGYVADRSPKKDSCLQILVIKMEKSLKI
jgi:type IV pilus assembly protein PilY1